MKIFRQNKEYFHCATELFVGQIGNVGWVEELPTTKLKLPKEKDPWGPGVWTNMYRFVKIMNQQLYLLWWTGGIFRTDFLIAKPKKNEVTYMNFVQSQNQTQ